MHFSIASLPCSFDILTMVFHGVILFRAYLLEFLYSSCIWASTFFYKFENILIIILMQALPKPLDFILSPSTPWSLRFSLKSKNFMSILVIFIVLFFMYIWKYPIFSWIYDNIHYFLNLFLQSQYSFKWLFFLFLLMWLYSLLFIWLIELFSFSSKIYIWLFLCLHFFPGPWYLL